MKNLMVICLALLVAGCGPVKTPPVSTYTITTLQDSFNPRRVKSHQTLLVNTPVASPGYASSNMIYIMVPFRLRSFANHRWVAPPSQMLLPIIAQRIRSTGFFKAVVTPPFSGITNYRLETNLIKLQQEFIDPMSHVRLVMQATLINSTTNRVVASRRFQVYLKAQANNPYSGVLAINRAATIMAAKLSNFVLRGVGRLKK